MTLSKEIADGISAVFDVTWNARDGQVVPTTDNVALINGAVKLEAVFLYADLFDSTELAYRFSSSVAAKVVRAYLSSMSRLIRYYDGEIRSFDGDRVMGVFLKGGKNTNSVKCALKMKYAVDEIIRPMAEKKFPSLAVKGYELCHCVGVDRGDVLVVRAGVRGSNDLVFVGTAPNLAAKLSTIRDGIYNIYITSTVFDSMLDEVKYQDESSKSTNMWTAVSVEVAGQMHSCYKSSYHWKV